MQRAPICDYCHRTALLVTGKDVYPHRPDLLAKKFWACKPCNAWVGCHDAGSWRYEDGQKIVHTGLEPMGRLADANLRKAKGAAHAAFDPLWFSAGGNRRQARQQAYEWLAASLGISVANCHIGMFDIEQCRRTVELCLARKGAVQ